MNRKTVVLAALYFFTTAAYSFAQAFPAAGDRKDCKPGLEDATKECPDGCCHYILWEIVSCADPVSLWQAPPGCQSRLPAPAKICPTIKFQDKSDAHAVVVNDSKMNACANPEFVHTLTIPRNRVCGVEDPDRLTEAAGAWEVAWKAGVRLIPEVENIGLVVNSPLQRTQNQLHIHTVRLKPAVPGGGESARRRLEAEGPVRVDRLDQVWHAAQIHASAHGRSGGYGIVVMLDDSSTSAESGSAWLVTSTDGSQGVGAADDRSPEARYTCFRCDTCPSSGREAARPRP